MSQPGSPKRSGSKNSISECPGPPDISNERDRVLKQGCRGFARTVLELVLGSCSQSRHGRNDLRMASRLCQEKLSRQSTPLVLGVFRANASKVGPSLRGTRLRLLLGQFESGQLRLNPSLFCTVHEVLRRSNKFKRHQNTAARLEGKSEGRAILARLELFGYLEVSGRFSRTRRAARTLCIRHSDTAMAAQNFQQPAINVVRDRSDLDQQLMIVGDRSSVAPTGHPGAVVVASRRLDSQ